MSVKSTIQFLKRRYVQKDWLELGKKPILNESWQYKVQRVHLCGRRHVKPDDGPNHQPEQSFSLVTLRFVPALTKRSCMFPWATSCSMAPCVLKMCPLECFRMWLKLTRKKYGRIMKNQAIESFGRTHSDRLHGLHVCLKPEHHAGSLPSSSYSRLLPGAQSIQIEKLEKSINSSHRRCNPQINKNKTLWSTAKFQLLKIIISRPNPTGSFLDIPGHIPVTPTVFRRVAVAQWLAS